MQHIITQVVTTCNDYLWLLAASEVVNNGYNGSGTYGYAITSEGSQYKYYQGRVTEHGTVRAQDVRRDPSASGSTIWWWLRSPHYGNSYNFCYIDSSGIGGNTTRATALALRLACISGLDLTK